MPDLTGAGTPEDAWSRLALPPLDLATVGATQVVVVAPHPDDEVLAAGGTVARLHAGGRPVVLIAVTDGEASHPGRADELREARPAETDHALLALDLGGATVQRLRHPDGAVDRDHVASALRGILREGDLVLAPWSADGHPDHDAVGAVCEEVCRDLGLELWAYPVWTWHWATLETTEVPWPKAFRVDLDPAVQQMKANAVACFASQLEGPEPILPEPVLAHFRRSFEVFWRP